VPATGYSSAVGNEMEVCLLPLHTAMFQFEQQETTNFFIKFFFHQLTHKRIALKGVLKFTLKQLQHVSV